MGEEPAVVRAAGAGDLVFDLPRLLASALAFASFCLCASSVYLTNDLLDVAADRMHPDKKKRPFAAGDLPFFHKLEPTAQRLSSNDFPWRPTGKPLAVRDTFYKFAPRALGMEPEEFKEEFGSHCLRKFLPVHLLDRGAVSKTDIVDAGRWKTAGGFEPYREKERTRTANVSKKIDLRDDVDGDDSSEDD